MMITRLLVSDYYQKVLQEVQLVIPLSSWAIQPTGLEFINHKTKYGQATINGKIQISEFFLGTDALAKLQNTLRHEFAHLCIGLHHHHNKKFRHLEMRFGVTEAGNDEQEQQKVLGNIPFKYTVYAHLVNGKRECLGGVHRKTKRYTEYNRNKTQMSFKNTPIEYFEFVENAELTVEAKPL